MKYLLIPILLLLYYSGRSQSPGLIVRPAGGTGITILNPNGDGYSSSTTSGFTSSDITESEVAYKIVPPAIIEPTGDIATGPSGGFTDIVRTIDGSGFYIYTDGTNMLFRLRIGNIISGSKGYSVLFDMDNKIGNSGTGADPNYIAPTNTSNGNPGFEYEVVLQTNFQVAVYNVDGSSNPGSPVSTYSLSSNSQISTALSADGNNPDYFYDWYVPLTAIGSPASFRLAATTVTSPSSALQGSRSDIYGIDDATSGVANAWTSVVKAQPAITISSIGSGGAGVNAVCTSAPIVNAPITPGSNIIITGSWTRMDISKPSSALITLYKNGASAGTYSVNSGDTWSITAASISPGDIIYAKAQASGESQCLQSNNITAGCSSIPASPTITCASTKGITGNIPLGSTINIYQVNTTNIIPTTTQISTGLTYTNNTTDQVFNYFGTNPQTGNACQGQNGILATNTTYMLIANNNGCLSAPTFICITGSSQNSWNYISSNTLSITTPIYPYQTNINGSGATSGQLLRLFINNQYINSLTATGSNFSFSGLTLGSGDNIKIYAQTSSACMTVSSNFIVSCYTQSPTITTNASGNLLSSSTSIGGTSAIPGATINLYKGTSPSGTLAGTVVVNSSGEWSVVGLTLVVNDAYYATQTSGSCTGPSSSSAIVLSQTTTCPIFGSASYADNASAVGGTISSFTGTVRVYLDGTLIGSTVLSNNTSWTIPVNTAYSNTLYTGGTLTVSAQSGTGSENLTCSSSATITCSPPSQPTITPTSSTINTGQSVTYSISNVTSNTWYAISDNSGISYATSVYTGNTSNFNIITRNFATPGTYNLKITADKLTGCNNTLKTATIIVNAASLPVNFVDINAKKESGGVTITWKVENETDLRDYEIQKSSDGMHFNTIIVVPANALGTMGNKYIGHDKTTNTTNLVHYRIKQNDIDGAFAYSKTVSVYLPVVSGIIIYPNPAKGNIFAEFFAAEIQSVQLSIYSITGHLTQSKEVLLNKGFNRLSVPLSGFPKGNYHLMLSGKTLSYVAKIIIN